MSHPITLVRRYYNNIAEGKYSAVRDEVLKKLRDDVYGDENPADHLDHLIGRSAHLTGQKARLVDKLNLIREIVAQGIGLDKSETLSDDDFLLIIAGWSAAERARFK